MECVARLGRIERMGKRALESIRHEKPDGAFTGATDSMYEIYPAPFFCEVLTDMVNDFALLSFRFQTIDINP